MSREGVVRLWSDRLDESAMRLSPGVDPETLADRFDVVDEEEIVTLSNAAVREMVATGEAEIRLEHFDRAADTLEVAP